MPHVLVLAENLRKNALIVTSLAVHGEFLLSAQIYLPHSGNGTDCRASVQIARADIVVERYDFFVIYTDLMNNIGGISVDISREGAITHCTTSWVVLVYGPAPLLRGIDDLLSNAVTFFCSIPKLHSNSFVMALDSVEIAQD